MDYTFNEATINWLKMQSFKKDVPKEVKDDLAKYLFALEGKKRGEPFGFALKNAREASGVTPAEAAQKAQITEAEWLQFENADSLPEDIKTVVALAGAININPMDLINGALDKSMYDLIEKGKEKNK